MHDQTSVFASTSMVLKQLPPRPTILVRSMTNARYFPGVTMLGMALWSYFTEKPSPVQAWIQANYSLSPQQYAVFALVFAVTSLLVARFPGPLKTLPTLEFIAAIILTFPLILYIVTMWWYSVRIVPETSELFTWFVSMMYFQMLNQYAANAGFRQWFAALGRWAMEQKRRRG